MAKNAEPKIKKPKSKPKPAPDDPEQSKRFEEAARELGADDNAITFTMVFEKIAKGKPPKQ